MEAKNERNNLEEIIDQLGFYFKIIFEIFYFLELRNILNRHIPDLSGGELQRFAIAMCAIQNADIYMFDEPSSYLDVRQRLQAAKVIRNLVQDTKFVFLFLFLNNLICKNFFFINF